jgi:hypothetical protein
MVVVYKYHNFFKNKTYQPYAFKSDNISSVFRLQSKKTKNALIKMATGLELQDEYRETVSQSVQAQSPFI